MHTHVDVYMHETCIVAAAPGETVAEEDKMSQILFQTVYP